MTMLGKGLVLAAVVAIGTAAVGAVPAVRGLYSQAQAAEGAQLYAQRCAMCHGAALEGTFEVPGLTGKFMANWAGRPVGDLYDYLGRAMPQFAPGTLAPQDNARIVAYLLQANGLPAGATPLPADSARLKAMSLTPAPLMPRSTSR